MSPINIKYQMMNQLDFDKLFEDELNKTTKSLFKKITESTTTNIKVSFGLSTFLEFASIGIGSSLKAVFNPVDSFNKTAYDLAFNTLLLTALISAGRVGYYFKYTKNNQNNNNNSKLDLESLSTNLRRFTEYSSNLQDEKQKNLLVEFFDIYFDLNLKNNDNELEKAIIAKYLSNPNQVIEYLKEASKQISYTKTLVMQKDRICKNAAETFNGVKAGIYDRALKKIGFK